MTAIFDCFNELAFEVIDTAPILFRPRKHLYHHHHTARRGGLINPV